MENAFNFAFNNMNYKKAIIIGSDLPEISVDIINGAIEKLDDYDSVIGPTFDGGYYLLGFNKISFCNEVFSDVDWSTDKVFRQTIEILTQQHHRFCIQPILNDIDNFLENSCSQ